jgi:NAD(P)-dependent dehydrogenase (short-subunit alcohol dehydrogenase family)
VHARSSPATSILQMRPSVRATDARACPRVLDLVYPSRTRGVLSLCKTDNGAMGPLAASAAIEEMTSAEWAEVFRVNVDATFACLQAAARSMSQRSQGAIVNTCSLSALCPAVRQSRYNSSKAAVLALTRSAVSICCSR